jgi:hypothetical protein
MQFAQFIAILGLLQNPSLSKGFWWKFHPKLLQFMQNFGNLEQLHM